MNKIYTTSPIFGKAYIANANTIQEQKSTESAAKEATAATAEGFVSKEYATGSKVLALAQMLTGTNLRNDITVEEYVNQLKKQGKVEGRDYNIEKFENSTYIDEKNSKGQNVKSVSIGVSPCDLKPIVNCRFIDPKTTMTVKTVTYHSDGTITTNTTPDSNGSEYTEYFDKNGDLKYSEVETYTKIVENDK